MILKTNKDGSIGYNQQILAAIFHIDNKTLKKQIIKEIKENKIIQDMIKDLMNSDKIIEEGGLVYINNLIYISKSIKEEIIAMHHNPPLHGHPETDQITELIARNYYILNLQKMILQYITKCETCK